MTAEPKGALTGPRRRPGGAAPKRKGNRAEYIVRDVLRAHGWYVYRSWGSLGSWDLLALRPGSRPAMVQVKSERPVGLVAACVPPAERARLIDVATTAGAQAIVAAYHGGDVYWAVLGPVPDIHAARTWEPGDDSPCDDCGRADGTHDLGAEH